MITVLGHRGFIGGEILRQLQEKKEEVAVFARDEDMSGKELGKVIYCIGLTADAKRLPFETLQAHLHKLEDLVRSSRFESITYASSTRVYVHGKTTASENTPIDVDVSDPFELFNLSKLTAESFLFNTVENFHSVRYSNVYGPDTSSENFLTSIIRDGLRSGEVVLQTTPDSAKDYISVQDAAQLTIKVATTGRHKIYNIASGHNTSNEEILALLQRELGCKVSYSQNAKRIVFPVIDTTKISEEFSFRPSTDLLSDFSSLINAFRKNQLGK